MPRLKASATPVGSVTDVFPKTLSPMLLHSQKEAFARDGWVFEPKLDGMRALAFVSNGSCKILSRSGRDITAIFPHLSQSLADHKGAFVLDAEIISRGDDGRPDFENLQARWLLSKPREIEDAERRSPTAFYAFDILHLDGLNLCGSPFSNRKEILFERLNKSDNVQAINVFNDGFALYAACKEQKLEGVVAKRQASLYRPGERSRDWIKVKFTQTDTFVILGFKKDEGFLVGKESPAGVSVVGLVQYGLTDAQYKQLMSLLRIADRAPVRTGRKDSATLWFEPKIRMNIEFMQWTKQGMLRFPVFRGFSDSEQSMS